ncbi:MAG TPA: hypothetical protein VII47_04545 [Actinomycetota bacterium]|jgi:hypothetical protein
MDNETEVAPVKVLGPLGQEVAESVLLLMIAALTLGGYVGVVMALLRVAH